MEGRARVSSARMPPLWKEKAKKRKKEK